MEAVFNVADDFLLHPENFAVSNEQNGEKATKAAETLFAHAKQTERKKTGALNTLLVDGFDSEQIWEQLQLLNIPALKHIDSAVNQLIKAKDLHFNLKEIDEEPKRKKTKVESAQISESEDENIEDGFDDEEMSGDDAEDSEEVGSEDAASEDEEEAAIGDEEEAASDEEEAASDEEEAESDEEGETTIKGKKNASGGKKASSKRGKEEEMEDDFFNMDEMNAFVDAAEREDVDEDEDEDEDEEDGDEDDDEELDVATLDEDTTTEKYSDFFDQPSKFGVQAAKMNKKIEKLEDAAVGDKGWAMSGEVGKAARPVNSLLEEDLIFDFATKVKPVITEEYTQSLEDIIKRRIVEGTFDDVVRKKPIDLEAKAKATVQLDSTKNTEGLGKLYEEQFMKQAYGIEKTPELDAEHRNIESLYRALVVQLDGLSHFHYIPKAVTPQTKEARKNVASVTMEEKVPMLVSDTTLLAPHEVHQQPSTIKSTDEFSREERKALRRRIKDKQANKKAADLNDPTKKAQAVQKSKTTSAALSSLKGDRKVTLLDKGGKGGDKGGKAGSSSSFFKTLQNEAESTVKNMKNAKNDNMSKKGVSASQLKL